MYWYNFDWYKEEEKRARWDLATLPPSHVLRPNVIMGLVEVEGNGRNRKEWEQEFAMACGGSMPAKPRCQH